MKRILISLIGLLICAVLVPELLLAQEVVWERTFCRSQKVLLNCVAQQTSDGGYILAGSINQSPQAYLNDPYNYDAFLIKTNEKGQEEWDTIFETEGADMTHSIQQTSDGGYILAGFTFNTSTDGSWLIKTDSKGYKEWKQTFSGSKVWLMSSLHKTSDGGYILAGSIAGVKDGDGWLIKTDSKGQKEWERTFDGTKGSDLTYAVQQTSDGGYILAGGLKTSGAWSSAVWLIKTDSKGQKEWEQTFGGESNNQCDDAYSVRQTSDGGYILAGRREYYRGDDNGWDAWLIKTDSKGYKEWDRIFAEGQGMTLTNSLQQTSDGGYILAGSRGNSSKSMGWVIKTDSKGYKKWDKTFYPSPEGDKVYVVLCHSVQQTSDGDYIVAGNIAGGSGSDVAWLTKLKGEPLTAVEEKSNTPETLTLSQNYPNPFNPRTEIAFSLPENTYVTLSVFNTLGQKVATLVDEKREVGKYQVTWDGTNFPSGVYFYRLETEAHSTNSGQGFTKTMKMLLMK